MAGIPNKSNLGAISDAVVDVVDLAATDNIINTQMAPGFWILKEQSVVTQTDIEIYAANSPFTFAVIDVLLLPLDGTAGAAELRNSANGNGDSLSNAMTLGTTDVVRLTAPGDGSGIVPKAGSLYLYPVPPDGAFAGTIAISCVRTLQ